MPNPWVSLRRDQLIPVNKAVSEKEQLEKGPEEEERKRRRNLNRSTTTMKADCYATVAAKDHNFSAF
jgi:hypothetical protein